MALPGGGGGNIRRTARHRHRVRHANEFENMLAIEFLAVEKALHQALARDEVAGVVGDCDRRQLHVRQRRLVEQADLLGLDGQFADAPGKRFAELLVALFEKVIRVILEELQIELEHAVAMAELVRVRNRKSRNELRHVHQRLAGNGEHLVTSRDRQQRGLVLRECLPATIWRLEIDGVADAEREDAVQRQLRLLAQDRPDVTGLLTGQRNQQIQRERRFPSIACSTSA